MASSSNNNSTVIMMDRGNNTTCTINLYGATVVSWRVNNQEQLFVSKQAIFDGSRAIRGGIPIVFPNFGPWGNGPQHGFARIAHWCVEKNPERLPNGDIEAIFFLEDNDYTRSLWNYSFVFRYRLILGEKELHINPSIYNRSLESFPFTLLLHTYFKVPDVVKSQIYGLQGCLFVDKTIAEGVTYQESREAVTVEQWTDRIYQATSPEIQVTNVVSGRKIKITKRNLPDTVVWNPWIHGAKGMSDFGDDEYRNMICVESGYVTHPFILQPGNVFEASQVLLVM